MGKFFVFCLVILSFSAFAQQLKSNYKSGMPKAKGTLPKLTKAEFDALWYSKKLVCIKRGGKVIDANEAYGAHPLKLKKSQCSNTDKALLDQQTFNYKVYKIEAYQVPSSAWNR